jgi:hypothetical protein
MAIDRINREAVAQALASFLRGELPLNNLLERVEEALLETDPDSADRGLGELWGDLERLTWSGAWLDRAVWERLRRSLAYLRSELEPPPAFSAYSGDLVPPRHVRLARWHLLALLVGTGLAALFGWWLLLAFSFGSWLLFVFATSSHSRRAQISRAETRRFAPFDSAEQWQAHQHLLQSFPLPDYNPTAPPLRPSAWSGRLGWLNVGFTVLLVLVLVPFVVVFGAFLWPLSLLSTALHSATPPDYLLNDPNWHLHNSA